MHSRRELLRSAALAAAGLVGCRDDRVARSRPAGLDDTGTYLLTPTGEPSTCVDPFANGTFLEVVPFTVASTRPFGEIVNDGWDARRLLDLADLVDGDLLTPPERFYIRTGYPDLLTTDPNAWTVRIDGLVDAQREVSIAEILDRSTPQGTILLECSGNSGSAAFGLMSSASWSGVPLLALIDELVSRHPSATAVRVEGFDEHSMPSDGGHSTPGAAWVVRIDELTHFGAVLATHLGGAPLGPDHGAPVRLLVPTWYGCSCIKWVTRITLVDDDEPATSQMIEFAARTHQDGVPTLARDYRAAHQELSATAIQVEKWLLDGALAYRVVGILWGGEQRVSALRIRLGGRDHPITCFEHHDNRTWNLWSHKWQPTAAGLFTLSNYVNEPLPQIRLDQGFYDRSVEIDEPAG